MTPASAQAAYVRALSSAAGPGELVTIVRSGVSTTYLAHAFEVPQIATSDLAGDVVQNVRKAVMLASDVAAAGFPLPFRQRQDRVVWASGRSNVISKASERRVQGVVIAYELELDGA